MAFQISDLFHRQPAMRVFAGYCSVHGEVDMSEVEQLDGSMLARGCKRCAWEALNMTPRDSEVFVQASAHRKAERVTSALIAAGITPRFAASTFDTFRTGAGAAQVHALTVCREYAECFPDNYRAGRSLILTGNVGCGKTHLATAIVRTVVADHAKALLVTAGEVIRVARGSMASDAEYTERDVLAHLASLDLLVIDEVGCQKGTEYELSVLHDVIDRRYQLVLPTVLISNLDTASLKAYIGDRALDRLRQNGGKAVGFTWPSMRAQA